MRAQRMVLLLYVLVAAGLARADWQTRSWSNWVFDGSGADVVFSLEPVELLRLRGDLDIEWLSGELQRSLKLVDATGECRLRPGERLVSDPRILQLRLRFDCGRALREPQIVIRVFFDAVRNPLHYAEFNWGDRGGSAALFTPGDDSLSMRWDSAPPGIASTVRRYVGFGFVHILAGLDHVAFLLCMLLVTPGLRGRVWMVSGFTLGHSLTLSLSVLGLLSVRGAAVESLIGFTVALLAMEVFMREQRSWLGAVVIAGVLIGMLGYAGRSPTGLAATSLLALLVAAPAYLLLVSRLAEPSALHLGMTSLFGLIHGLGFASVLKALGLPEQQQGWALLGFNLGVELGQLVLLGGFLSLMWLAAGRLSALREIALRLGSSFLCALGIYWFVGRGLL